MTRRSAVNPKKLRPYDQPPRRRLSLIPRWPDAAAASFLVAAALWLALAGAIGLLAIGLRIFPLELSYELPVFGWSLTFDAMRVDYALMNATVYGWLSNAGFAAVCFMTPRLTGRRLALEPLLMLAVLSWNGALMTGIAGLYVFDPAPHSPLTAMLWLFDGGLAFAAFLVTASFLVTAATSLLTGYIALWFAGVALMGVMGITGLDALVGLIGVFLALPELAVALGSAFIERALPAMWLLGITLAILHYAIPRATGLPLASWGLALLAFLTWVAFAPLTGFAALTDQSVPVAVTSFGAMATILLLVPVTFTVANLVSTMQGRWMLLFGAGAASLGVASLTFLLAASLMQAIGSLRTVDAAISGTDWDLGLMVWMAYGAFTFAALALAHHAWPRILRRAWRENQISVLQLWFVFAGTLIAGVALFGGGLAQSSFLASAAAPEEMSAGMLPYRVAALAGFGLVALAALAHLVNLFLLYTTAEPERYAVPGRAAPAAAGH